MEEMSMEEMSMEEMPIEEMQKNTDLQTIETADETAEEAVKETDAMADTLLQDEEQVPGHSRGKRIAALTGVILLIVMVLATLVVACLDFHGSHQLFMVLVFCDISVPVFLWFILHFLH
ncbi:MAG: hypothetical protein ACI4DW_05220 [Lachnospiraceae bacterium]